MNIFSQNGILVLSSAIYRLCALMAKCHAVECFMFNFY